jgi:hypothetical protein
MPFEFMIHMRGDRNGFESVSLGDSLEGRNPTSSSQPQGLQLFLTENRIDLGNIMQVYL